MSSTSKASGGGDPPVTPAARPTPLGAALNGGRDERVRLIEEIQDRSGRRLIAYVAGVEAGIDRDDTLGLADLLYDVTAGATLDLLLNTPGGDVNAAEKLIHVIRKRIGDAHFRIIVPDFAKSAGTLMALGANVVVMSDTSELGPIDPQVIRSDGNGNRLPHSILNYLEAYEELSETLEKDPNNVHARVMLSKFDLETVKLFRAVKERTRSCAERLLQQWMFKKTGGNWSKTVTDLLDNKRWPSHGQMISFDDAVAIGLEVHYLPQCDPEWDPYWRLYCLQRGCITSRQKLFESEHVFHTLDGPASGPGAMSH